MNFSAQTKNGFTLIEILIAIALVVTMGAIAGFGILNYLERGRKKATQASLRIAKTAINTYYTDVGQFPESLNDLVKKPTEEEAAQKWEGPYLESKTAPVDGWGQKLIYHKTLEGENPYELQSYGSNRGKATPKEQWIDAWKL